MSEEVIRQFNSLKQRFKQLSDDVRMDVINREVTSIETKIHNMPAEIQKIRQRGYAFRSYLEQKAEVFSKHWEALHRRITMVIEQEVGCLSQEFSEVERRFNLAERVANHPERLAGLLDDLRDAVQELDEKTKASVNRAREVYATLKKDVDENQRQLDEINWFCDVKDEATFDLLAGESLFMVAKGEWVATGKGKDDPDGYLYLTDQRIVFEQKEKVGKKLGLFGGKQVQEVEWEIPLNQIEGVEWENKGLFGGKDMLHFTLRSGAPYDKITVEVKGAADNKYWVKQIERMIAGETNDERAIEPDPEMVEKLRNAPTECHICGATLPPLAGNMNQVSCEYCGSVIRI
ncbi:MAG: hypothetical protein D6711_14820 [Chloroflexi bacterium]|nr:MAG: hypothetical protein D6711_14820 [Chloroflexota bacterium]